MSKKEVGVARCIDPASGWSLAPKFRWVEAEADPALVAKALEGTNKQIQRELEIARREKLDADSLTFQELVGKCQSLKVGFIDAEFPPNEKALVSRKTSDAKPKVVQWRRAREFLGAEAAMFSGGIEPGDIQQGELGDCWFVVL
jgi:hypothetical protein